MAVRQYKCIQRSGEARATEKGRCRRSQCRSWGKDEKLWRCRFAFIREREPTYHLIPTPPTINGASIIDVYKSTSANGAVTSAPSS